MIARRCYVRLMSSWQWVQNIVSKRCLGQCCSVHINNHDSVKQVGFPLHLKSLQENGFTLCSAADTGFSLSSLGGVCKFSKDFLYDWVPDVRCMIHLVDALCIFCGCFVDVGRPQWLEDIPRLF